MADMLPLPRRYNYHWSPASGVEGWVPGRCAVCRDEAPVHYCALCRAVICIECNHKYFQRGVAAVKAMMSDNYKGEILVREEV